jgi:CubicO group peptidase (beta-lactamase class C family)
MAGHTQSLSQTEEIYIDSLMQAHYKANEPGAVILIAKKGKPLFRKAYGMASLELNVLNKPEYAFRVGSIAKQFTAVCILQLAEQGKLFLTDDIRKYLPSYNSHGREITLEHLLTHTSGIPSYTAKNDFDKKVIVDHSKEEIMEYFMQDSLLFEPGSDWSYCNSGYFLAGMIVEKVSGKSLSEYLQKNIFDLLGMSNTYFGSYEKVIPSSVTGYEPTGKGVYKPASYLSWTWPFAAGSLISTVDDLLKWDEALYSEKILKQEWLQKAWNSFILTNGQKANYGYGWAINSYKGVPLVTHEGGINGFLSNGIRIPSQHLYVIILSNNLGVNPMALSNKLALHLAGQPFTTPQPVKISSKQLQTYTGVYRQHRMGSIVTSNISKEPMYRYLTLTQDTLFSQFTGGPKTALLPVGKDLFLVKGYDLCLKFIRDKNQHIVFLERQSEPIHYGSYEREAKTTLPFPKEKVVVSLQPMQLQGLSGKYDMGGGYFLTITVQGNHLYIQKPGEEAQEVFAESETKFFLKKVDATIEFRKEESGHVNGITYNPGNYQGKKIE